ncbi:MAG: MmgE/PrpD family protein, partial [Chloroflexota bacterium]
TKAKLLLLDSLGSAVAATTTEWGRTIIELATELGGPGESTVIGTPRRLPAANAAMANGSLIHGLDFDDTYLPAVIHPSCSIIPAVLATGEATRANGRTLILAATAGYETIVRIARAGRNNFFLRHFHTAGVFGPTGAGMGAARVMGLDANTIASTLGIAASLGGGILQTQVDGTAVKVLHPAWGAHGGIVAAKLAAKGFAGPRHIYEGELGFFKTYLGEGNYDLDALTNDLGTSWHMLDISFKFYPGGHAAHFYIESFRCIKGDRNLKPEDVDEICCIVSPRWVNFLFQPASYAPPNAYIARFSLPYLVAIALLHDEIAPESFTPQNIADGNILELARKVTYRVAQDADQPQNWGRVVVKTKAGQTYEHKEKYILGEPEKPATKEDLQRKFQRNAGRLLGTEKTGAILREIDDLENLTDIGRLVGLTTRAAT